MMMVKWSKQEQNMYKTKKETTAMKHQNTKWYGHVKFR